MRAMRVVGFTAGAAGHQIGNLEAKSDISQTWKSVCEIVLRLCDQGYKFETVSEVLAA